MINWLRLLFTSRQPHLTFPEHYGQTCLQGLGEKQSLKLVHAQADSVVVTLVYRWTANLSHEQADALDTRARGYMSCAIYDAAITAGLACDPGPLHGQRPSWLFQGERIPVSLINAGFDVGEKTCFMQIGPRMMMMRGPSEGGNWMKKLMVGFRVQFSKIYM